jgi:hypothetical protein
MGQLLRLAALGRDDIEVAQRDKGDLRPIWRQRGMLNAQNAARGGAGEIALGAGIDRLDRLQTRGKGMVASFAPVRRRINPSEM